MALLMAGSARAATITAADQIWTVAPGGTTTAYIYASGVGESVTAVDLFVRVADGTEGSGPALTSIRLNDNANMVFYGGFEYYSPANDPPKNTELLLFTNQDAYDGSYFASGSQSLGTHDLLATVGVDATGVAPGDYALSLTGQDASAFTFWGTGSTNLTDGTVHVTPEPVVLVQLLGVMAAGGPLFWLVRRRRQRSI